MTRSFEHRLLTRDLLTSVAQESAAIVASRSGHRQPTGEALMFRTSVHRIQSSITSRVVLRIALVIASILLTGHASFAQAPWERAANNLAATFTGSIARSLALVAIVIGGLMFMFGEAGAKRQISGIVFGGGLALFAAQFLTWLF